MWKDRAKLPVFLKLKEYQFDPVQLLEAYHASANETWDGLGNEYASLCKTYSGLPEFFLKDDELSDIESGGSFGERSYQQQSLVEFDPDFSLDKRTEKSGTRWDHTVAKSEKSADERWFRKRKAGLHSYFQHVLDTIGKDIVHRSRLAKLLPHSEIKPHVDYNTFYGLRLHIPIVTNSKCHFGGEDKQGKIHQTHMASDGSVWFINPGLKHWATNFGDTERVHLILSVDSQKWFQ